MSHLSKDLLSNVGSNVLKASQYNMLREYKHPLNILAQRISDHFSKTRGYSLRLHQKPITSVFKNFDELCFAPDNDSKSPSNTYYFNRHLLLRSHMTSVEREIFKEGKNAFLVAGPVFRRDEIDHVHYPIFHQLEGVCYKRNWSKEECMSDLKKTILDMIVFLFGEVDYRWCDTYFPYTDPSIELEIFHEGRWIEILGSGILQSKVLIGLREDGCAWAFGIGLERLAMILFKIPDVRIFWSTKRGFFDQFDYESHNYFNEILMEDPISLDISFWLGPKYVQNDLFEIAREVASDEIKEIKLVRIESFRLTNLFILKVGERVIAIV